MDVFGNVVAHYEYDAFGQVVAFGSKKDDFTHQFSTKELDSESGLHYYGYRYYDFTNGRWLGRDPLEELGGVNIYGAMRNAATYLVDILGLSAECSSETPETWQTMKGEFVVDKFSIKGSKLLTTGADLRKPIDGFYDFIPPFFNDKKLKGIRVINLDFDVDLTVSIGIKCSRCTCFSASDDTYGWSWKGMKPLSMEVNVQFPLRNVGIRWSPNVFKKLKKLERMRKIVENGGTVDWNTVIGLAALIDLDTIKKGIDAGGHFKDEKLKSLCEKHWESTNELPK